MRGWIRAIAIGGAVFAACGFHPNGNSNGDGTNTSTGSDGSVPSDGPLEYFDAPDAGPCNVTASCSGNMLTACVAGSDVAATVTCSWGCSTTPVAHCAELAPAGGVAIAADTVGSDVTAFTITGATTLDTRTGLITMGPTTLRAAGTGVISGIDFEKRTTGAVFRFGSLAIQAPVSFAYDNDHNLPVVLVSTSTLDLEAAIDGQGVCSGNAGGGGPGSFRGANGHSNASGSGGGSG
ncbi:MAG TPA: hypothetical protein VGG28_12865, partial [Kofleriaceae bacterium]